MARCGNLCLGAAVVWAGLACSVARAAVTLLGTTYQPDQAFPEHQCFWNESQFPGPCSAAALGANLHVYVRNTGPSSVTISDVTLAGYSLSDILRLHYQVAKRQPASIYLDGLSAGDLQALINAGEPVWYKMDPATIPVGGVARVVVRLRGTPVTQPVSIGVVTSAGTLNTTVPVELAGPQIVSVGFAPDLTKVYLHWRRSGGAVPASVWMDGTDVTASTTTVGDPGADFAVSVIQPAQPLASMSFHVFRGVYVDGKAATAGLRAWVNPFLYGTWGGHAVADGDDEAARESLIDFVNHGMNTLVQNGSCVTAVLQKSVSGRQFVASQGYGFVIDEIGKWSADQPRMWFIRDEPDAADSRVTGIPSNKVVGSLAQMAVGTGETLRAAYPLAPTTLNIDSTYKPYNWYNYGQVPDVFMTDPYYQVRMREAYWALPSRIPLYQKATYIYAVGQLAASSCMPNPLHMVLYSCEWRDSSGAVFPFPTPESKRIEVYYALAAGAKGISYWWYLDGAPSNGLDAATPPALALWREIGLLGAEIQTAAPLLVTSAPVALPLQPGNGVWARALAVSNDTIILLAVNDQYLNDEAGCHYTPVSNASVTVTLPTWLSSPSAFEISAGGLADVATQLNTGQLQVNLGTLNLTRMIVLTQNPQLRATIQQRYDQLVQARVCAFALDVCSQQIPPTVTQHPPTLTQCAGTNTVLSIVAAGPGTLTHQWQKNPDPGGSGSWTNLTDNGHFSGATTPTLTITSVAIADTASYRCVVTNNYGSTNSNPGVLTVIQCLPGCLQNLSFESGFTNGAGNGWNKFIKVGTEGPNLVFSDETTERHHGLHSQEVYSHDIGYDGGVYQQFSSVPGQPYTIRAWIKVYSPQGTGIAEGFFGVDPTGGTNPNAGTVLWASKPWDYWSQDEWNITATGNYITVYLRGRSTRSASNNRVAYVWLDDVEITPGAPTDLPPQALSPTSIRWRWVDLDIETGYRLQDQTEADKSGLLPADTAQWTETTGILPNTQYTRYVRAMNDCGTSHPSPGQSTFSLIETPAGISVDAATTTSITVGPVGSFSNLSLGSSGVRVSNATAGTDSGWQTTVGPWASTGLTPNMPYDFAARARNAGGVETPDSDLETVWTLSVPPTADSVTTADTTVCTNASLSWTAVGGFGPGTVQYYRYAWDQNPTHSWTGHEPRWQGGLLVTSPASPGTWYLHVQGCNGGDVDNGTYDYAVTVGPTVGPDADGDCDVDGADFDLLRACLSRAQVAYGSGCGWADFDQDGDADLADFAVFQRCYRGEGVPADLNCTD